MKKTPLVSVIIPTYNRISIKSSIDSVLDQTYKNIEIIVIDDNIDEKISSGIKKEIKKYKDIIYIKNKINLGGALARNVGIYKSKGEFIAFLDDDDEFLPNKIERQLDHYYSLNNKSIAVITCDTINYMNNKFLDNEKHINIKNDMVKFLCNKTATTSTWLAKKDCILKVNGFDEIRAHQEGLLMIKLLDAGYESYNLKEYLLIRNKHSDNSCISNLNKKYIEITKEFIKSSNNYMSKLSTKQKNKIEFQFHSILFHLYYLNNDYDNAIKEYKILCKMKLFSIVVIKKTIRIFQMRLKNEKS